MANEDANDLIKPPGGGALSARVRQGGALVSGGFAAAQGIRLASNLILTRLLAPEAFGLVAAAMSISVLAAMVSDIGINSSIIRSDHSDNPRFLRTAWTMSVIRNAGLCVAICLAAAALYYFQSQGAVPGHSIFAAPDAPPVIAAMGFQALVAGFVSTNAALAERHLQMMRLVGLSLANQVLTTIVTVALAVAGFGVWAIVCGMIAGTTTNAIISHFAFPGPKMGLVLDRGFLKEIFGFGKWLILASLFGFVTTKGDSLIFGWAMDDQAFGLYSVATIWSLAAIDILETLNRRILYPAFSEIRRIRKHDLARVYKKSRLMLDGAAFFLGLSGIVFADFAFSILYNETFVNAAHFLRLLMPLILLHPYRLLHNVILAEGDSRNFTRITFVTGAATLVFAPLGLKLFGPDIGVLVFSSAPLLAAPLAIKIASKSMPIDFATEARAGIVTVCAIIYLILG